jgi:GNAT superfamily N-acetyltransferase
LTETTIRRLSIEDLADVLFPLTEYAFHPSPAQRDREAWEQRMRERKGMMALALYADGVPAATVVGSPMTQQVRGKAYAAGAVWGVATDPAYRRRGYCRRLMVRLLAAFHEEGQPLSCLYPFRASFYERLGYTKWPLPPRVRFDPAMLRPLLKKDLGGRVERIRLGDGYDIYRAYLKRLQRRTHGMAVFVHGSKQAVQREHRYWLALARVDDEVVGVMVYRLEGSSVTQFTLRAERFYYDTSQAKYLLLQWIARHIDQAGEAQLWLRPGEDPEIWLPDLHAERGSPARGPMGRVVDVAALGGMETGPGRFSARVSDPHCPWNEGGPADGLWAFETVDGQLVVRPTDRADCDLSIHALSGLVYGAHDPGDFLYRGWGNPSADTQMTMRRMFPPREPYLHEYF